MIDFLENQNTEEIEEHRKPDIVKDTEVPGWMVSNPSREKTYSLVRYEDIPDCCMDELEEKA